MTQTSLKYQGSEHESDSDSVRVFGRGLEITESEDVLEIMKVYMLSLTRNTLVLTLRLKEPLYNKDFILCQTFLDLLQAILWDLNKGET